MPSFSLGLTQEWDGIVNLARDAVELAEKEAGINPDLHGTPHRPESSFMEDTSDVGRPIADTMGVNAPHVENARNIVDTAKKDTMGVNTPDVENAGNIVDIAEKGKGVAAVGKRKYKARGRGEGVQRKGKRRS